MYMTCIYKEQIFHAVGFGNIVQYVPVCPFSIHITNIIYIHIRLFISMISTVKENILEIFSCCFSEDGCACNNLVR